MADESGIIDWTSEGFPVWLHDPGARLEYWIDLEEWLPAGDLLDVGSDVTAEAPLVVDNVEIQAGYKLIGWVNKEPTATGDLKVFFSFITTHGREDERTIVLRCVDR